MRMSLPALALPRDLWLAGLSIILVVVPIAAGFATADGARSALLRATEATETSELHAADDLGGPVERSATPLGRVPDSVDEALTRLDAGGDDPARIRYEVGDSGPIGIRNGEAIDLGDGLEAQLTVSPYPPADFDVDVAIQLRVDGVPLTDATVATTWDMVFMYHGPFSTEMNHSGQGRYIASYDFFMFGPWELQTRVERPDGAASEFAVSIYVWPTG